MGKFLAAGWFAARQTAVVALVSLAAGVAWTLLYGGLFLWAAFAGGGMGGPLAYPFGLLLVLLCCCLPGVGIFIPACAFGAWVRGRWRLPRWSAIPWVILAASLLTWLWRELALKALSPEAAPPSLPVTLAILALPLGLHWWLTEGPATILELALCQLKKMIRAKMPPPTSARP